METIDYWHSIEKKRPVYKNYYSRVNHLEKG
jgi:hypothetical protein